jgi:hypothetical protein
LLGLNGFLLFHFIVPKKGFEGSNFLYCFVGWDVIPRFHSERKFIAQQETRHCEYISFRARRETANLSNLWRVLVLLKLELFELVNVSQSWRILGRMTSNCHHKLQQTPLDFGGKVKMGKRGSLGEIFCRV